MRTLGIDVGTAITGWSIVEKAPGGKYNTFGYGVIKTDKSLAAPERLVIIFNELNEIITTFKPDQMAVEELFYFKNSKTVITVGQARGVILLAGKLNKLQIAGYTPLQVKQAVTGYGKAEKDQIQKMVKLILKLDQIPKPDDAADALAIAICHLNSLKSKTL